MQPRRPRWNALPSNQSNCENGQHVSLSSIMGSTFTCHPECFMIFIVRLVGSFYIKSELVSLAERLAIPLFLLVLLHIEGIA